MREIPAKPSRGEKGAWVVFAAVLAGSASGCGARCEREVLTTAARSLDATTRQWTPALGHVADSSAEAVVAVWGACPGLPNEAKAQLDRMLDHQGPWASAGEPPPADRDAFLEPRIPGHGGFHGALPPLSASTWSGSACQDYDAMTRAVAGSAEVAATLYDVCELQRFEVVSREEFTAMQAEPSLVGFALARDLRQDGVGPDVARTLARALVLADRNTAAALAAVSLPTAEHGERSPWITGVTWSPRTIAYADRRVIELEDDGSVDPSALEAGSISPLREMLESEHDMHLRIAAEGEVLAVSFAIDRGARWRDVAAGLAAAAAAGWTEARLVVLAADPVAPLHALPLSLATRDAAPIVAVGDAGATVRCSLADEPAALADRPACLVAGASVMLEVSADQRWQAVIDALDDLRGHGVGVSLAMPPRS